MKLTKRQKVGVGALTTGIITGGVALWKCTKAPPPPPPPPPGMAQFQGIVTDADTGEAIPDALLYVDGEFETYAGSRGNFRTGSLGIGHHIVTITSPFYQTGTFEVDLVEGLQRIDFALYKTPITEGFEVLEAGIYGYDSHAIITLGEEIIISSLIGNLSPNPCTQTVCCYLNGESQCREVTFTGGYHQPGWTATNIPFTFVPTQIGLYTVKLGNWAGTVEVKAIALGEFYCPYCINTRPYAIGVVLKDGTRVESNIYDGMPLGIFERVFYPDDIASIEWDAAVTVSKYSVFTAPPNIGGFTSITAEDWTPETYWQEDRWFVSHVTGHIQIGTRIYCPYCSKELETPVRGHTGWALFEHIRDNHPLSCYICDKDLTFCSNATNRGDIWVNHLAEYGIVAPLIDTHTLYAYKGFFSLQARGRTLPPSISSWHWTTTGVLFQYFNATLGFVGEGWFVPMEYSAFWPSDPYPEEQTELRIFEDYRVGAMKFRIPALADKSWMCQIVQCGSENVWDEGYKPVVRCSFTGSGDTIIIEEWKLCALRPSHVRGISFVIKYDSQVLVLANMYVYGGLFSGAPLSELNIQKVADFDVLLADP